MATTTKLSILIVGPQAKEIQDMSGGIILPDDDVQISDSKADLVIGTNCIRAYPNTANFLSTLIKKIRMDKKLLDAPKVKKSTKKKSTKKKSIEATKCVFECKTLETMLEETNLAEINNEKL